MITSTNHMSPTNKEGSLDKFHNRKNVDYHCNTSQCRGRNHPTEVVSTWETNTMMNNDQVHRRENKENNQ
jgi:hypothetical protein